MTTPIRPVLSIDDVCKRLGLARSTIYLLIRRKMLKTMKLGRRRLVRESDLERMLDRAAL